MLSPLIICTSLIILVAHTFKEALSSPLNKVPGPWYSKFTSLVLKWHELRAKRTGYIHQLHLRYGPAVRIAPNEVAFASAAAVKEIYGSGGSGYDKTDWYDLFKVYGRRTMFTTLNKDDHAKRKRTLADRYANTNIVRAPCLDGIAERASIFVKRCSETVNGSLDIYMTLHAYAFDCVTHHLFHPHGTNSLQNDKDADIMREVTLDDSLQNRLTKHYYPTLHAIFGRLLSLFAKPRSTPLADNFVLEATSQTDTAAFTLLHRLQQARESDRGGTLDALDVAAECLDHMVAGIDTTGDALCFLMWELSQPSSIHFQRRLQAELRRLLANSSTEEPGGPTAASCLDVRKFPYLDAVVNEGLRCFPAIPMSLPRRVPSGGRTIDGFLVPGGTTVSCQACSVQRLDGEVFPDPDVFRPDRWLEEKGEAERRRLSFAFASGGRGCIGKHLALAEMKLLLQAVYSRFTTLPDDSMTPEDMEMSDQLISSRPKGQKCLLRFVPLTSVNGGAEAR